MSKMLNESILLSRAGFQAPARASNTPKSANAHFGRIPFAGLSTVSVNLASAYVYKGQTDQRLATPQDMRIEVTNAREDRALCLAATLSAAFFVLALIAAGLSFVPRISEISKTAGLVLLLICIYFASSASDLARDDGE